MRIKTETASIISNILYRNLHFLPSQICFALVHRLFQEVTKYLKRLLYLIE